MDLFGSEFMPESEVDVITLEWVDAAFDEHEQFSEVARNPISLLDKDHHLMFANSNLENLGHDDISRTVRLTTSILPELISIGQLAHDEEYFLDRIVSMILIHVNEKLPETLTANSVGLMRPSFDYEKLAHDFAIARRETYARDLQTDEFAIIMKFDRGGLADNVALYPWGQGMCGLGLSSSTILVDYNRLGDPVRTLPLSQSRTDLQDS